MVWIIGGIALAGLVLLAVLGWQVASKLADLKHEVQVLQQRRSELDALTAGIQLPHRSHK